MEGFLKFSCWSIIICGSFFLYVCYWLASAIFAGLISM